MRFLVLFHSTSPQFSFITTPIIKYPLINRITLQSSFFLQILTMQHRSIKANNPKAKSPVPKINKRTTLKTRTCRRPPMLLRLQHRGMAAPASKAFQISGQANVIAPLNPHTSKSLFRAELLKAYNRDGYALVKNVFSPADIESIHHEMVELCRGKNPSVVGVSRSIDPNSITDSEALQAYSCIQFPLKASEVARKTVFSNPQILTGLKSLIGNNIKCVSSEYWIQSSEHGQNWSQDESVIMTRDKSLVLALIALDDLTTANGTPLLHPASHKSGILYPTPHAHDENSGSDTSYDWISLVKKVDPTNKFQAAPDELSEHSEGLPSATASRPSMPKPTLLDQMDAMTSVPVEMPAGSVLFVNGYCLQRMVPNPNSEAFRRLLRVHFSSAETQVSWNISDSHLEGLSTSQLLDIRDVHLVAGTDPYEYKGYQNIFPAQVIRRHGAPVSF
jgi:ectoine hydroxylase-related dioxygenase (phytanoyl-CoA dioxygenase family)